MDWTVLNGLSIWLKSFDAVADSSFALAYPFVDDINDQIADAVINRNQNSIYLVNWMN